MEYFDVLDGNGKKTGTVKSREEVHRDGDWHAAAHAWILNTKGELLLQLRAATKDTSPNKWDISFAGHVEAGHAPKETAIREAKEELNLDVNETELVYLFTATQQKMYEDGRLNNEFNQVFLLNKDIDPASLTLQEDEVAELKYMPWREVQQHITENDPSFVEHPDEYKKLFEYLARTQHESLPF